MHKALGKGLDALLPASPKEKGLPSKNAILTVPVGNIQPNPAQPRQKFSQEALADLSASIKAHGIAQPILVSPGTKEGTFQLVAGERRLRAAKLAGLAEVPCVLRHVSTREKHELALIENIQREDLNPIEEAEGIKELMTSFSLTQEQVASTLGRSRSAVANKLRLLDLPQLVQESVREGQLTEGHARALLGIVGDSRREELGQRVLNERLTVRDLEKIVADWQTARKSGRVTPAKRKDPNIRHLEEELQKHLGRRVQFQGNGRKKGWVKLAYYSLEDLDRLIGQLKATKKQ